MADYLKEELEALELKLISERKEAETSWQNAAELEDVAYYHGKVAGMQDALILLREMMKK